MQTKLATIAHETEQHWIERQDTGYAVYRIGSTHSTRCAWIGFTGDPGLKRAIAEVERRESTVASTGA